MTKRLRQFLTAGVAFSALVTGGTAVAEEDILDYVTPIFDARARYEFVDQEGFSKNANAFTVRARVGAEVTPFEGFSILAEGEFVEGLNNTYNSTTNGRTQYPVVADPDNAELNRLQVSYFTDYGGAIVGRQRIIFDNARFVGNVGWRQNEQTFDAALVDLGPFEGLKGTYAYVNRVETIFGNESPNGDIDAETQFIHLGYTGLDWLDAVAYAYLIDLEDRPAASSQSYGLRAVASHEVEDVAAFEVVGEFARQTDYGPNPLSYAASYYHGSIGAKRDGFNLSAAVEVLTGDGTSGFQTPLATLHKFQGWADVFLATPANGIVDIYGQVGYTSGEVGPFAKIVAAAIYHDFSVQNGSGSLGHEVDLLLKGVINKRVSVTAKYANYIGPNSGGPADRNKFWFQVDFKY